MTLYYFADHIVLITFQNDGLLQLTLTDKIKPHVLSVPVVTQSEDNLIPGLVRQPSIDVL